ncbi:MULTISPECIES: hypothetical protein [Acidobacteriaceae]|uniref:hypothetical protein n=1 Tax=Acidobacteriaceae TaxID=204434 RepID=UPI00131E95A1|nr:MULTISPECIES: hypothetical protein [Acidobacteriaceae]MDW5266183.1 hypothetical protein [Edaphobacter sp.]
MDFRIAVYPKPKHGARKVVFPAMTGTTFLKSRFKGPRCGLSWKLFWESTVLGVVSLQRELNLSFVLLPQLLICDQLLYQASDSGIMHRFAWRKDHDAALALILIPKEESLGALRPI